jgi:hypothetical protein
LLVLLKLPHGGVELPNRRSSENPTNNPHPASALWISAKTSGPMHATMLVG